MKSILITKKNRWRAPDTMKKKESINHQYPTQ